MLPVYSTGALRCFSQFSSTFNGGGTCKNTWRLSCFVSVSLVDARELGKNTVCSNRSCSWGSMVNAAAVTLVECADQTRCCVVFPCRKGDVSSNQSATYTDLFSLLSVRLGEAEIRILCIQATPRGAIVDIYSTSRHFFTAVLTVCSASRRVTHGVKVSGRN